MQTYFNFFMDLFVLPVCIYAAAYGFAWLIAFVLARLFVNQLGIERAATRAWGIAIFAHMIFGTGAVVWIWTLAIHKWNSGGMSPCFFCYMCWL